MSITRVSLADLLAEPVGLSDDERSFIDRASDDDLSRGALSDPDLQPWTDTMFADAQRRRERRIGPEGVRMALTAAEPDAGLGVWAVTDEQGRTVFLQAARVERTGHDAGISLMKIVAAPSDTSGRQE